VSILDWVWFLRDRGALRYCGARGSLPSPSLDVSGGQYEISSDTAEQGRPGIAHGTLYNYAGFGASAAHHDADGTRRALRAR